jgi:hypothetical protein
MRLAAQEGVPLWKVKRITPYREFLLWKAKWELEDREKFEVRDKQDFYLAQIAREVRVVLMRAADAKKVSLNDFLLKFKLPERVKKTVVSKVAAPTKTPEELEAEALQKATKQSQQHWFRFLGLNKDKKSNGEKNSP